MSGPPTKGDIHVMWQPIQFVDIQLVLTADNQKFFKINNKEEGVRERGKWK